MSGTWHSRGLLERQAALVKVTIRLTTAGSTWRVGRIEVTSPTEQKCVEPDAAACRLVLALQAAIRQAVEMVSAMGYRPEEVKWDVQLKRPNEP
jgi:hypothetical protein